MGSGISGYKLLYNKKAIEGYLRRRYGVLNQDDNVIKMIDSALLNCPFDINMDTFRMDRLAPCSAVPVVGADSNAVPGGINGKKHKHSKEHPGREGAGCGVGGELMAGHQYQHQYMGQNDGTYSFTFVFRSECGSSIRVCANRQDKKGEYICVANWKDFPPGTHTYSTIIQDMIIPLEAKAMPTAADEGEGRGAGAGAGGEGGEGDEIALDEEHRRRREKHKNKKNKNKDQPLGDPTKKQAALATTGCILCVNVKLHGGEYKNNYGDPTKGKRETQTVGLAGGDEMKLDPITCVDSCTYFFSLTLDKTKFTATNNVVIPHLAMRKISHKGCTYLCESVFAASTDMAATVGGDKKEQALCCICMTETANTLFLPCRHLAMCEGCTKEYVNRGSMCCPICREQATSIVEFKK